MLAKEDQDAYDDLLARFMRDEQPANDVERELVAKERTGSFRPLCA